VKTSRPPFLDEFIESNDTDGEICFICTVQCTVGHVQLVYQDFHLSSVFLVGNGQHSSQLPQQLVTCIFTRFTTSFSRPSKCHSHQYDNKMGNIFLILN